MDIPASLLLVLAGLGAAQGLYMVRRHRRRDGGAPPSDTSGQAVFLFRDDILIDTTPAAQHLLALSGREGRSLAAVVSLLSLRFPALPPALETEAAGEQILTDDTTQGRLVITRWARFIRLTLSAATPELEGADAAQPILQRELAALRAIADDAPYPIWKEDADGRVNWANRAYLALAFPEGLPADQGFAYWPDAPLFADLPRPVAEGESTHARATLPPQADEAPPAWYEVICVRRGGQVIGFAQDASGAVAAEDNRRTLLQTLTKTFAHLTAGLAVFDRHRRLVLFNPAFLDLTGLRVDFLSQRPLVHSVLDKLHDMQMLPEPRHYRSWREQLTALEAAAEQGQYCETWSLPNGLTYRVSGRPHGDGALAFVFEDISDESALARQIRAEQEAVQAILDRLPHAMAAFSRGGAMILHNAAYDRLWPDARGVAKAGAGILTAQLAQEMARWRRGALPGECWADLSASLTAGDSLTMPEEVAIQTLGGQALRVLVTPLANGVRQVEFLLPATGGAAPDPQPPAKPQARPMNLPRRAEAAFLGGGT